MPDQDNRISQNRRRLFKALTSVPVVATLAPGSALATQSAFQCASKVRANSSDFNTFPQLDGGDQALGPFAVGGPNTTPGDLAADITNPNGLVPDTELRYYALLRNGTEVAEPDNPDEFIPCGGTEVPDKVGYGVIFRGNPNSSGDANLRLQPNNSGEGGGGRFQGAQLVVDGSNRKIVFFNDEQTPRVCYEIPVEPEPAYWAKVVKMSADETDVETYRNRSFPFQRARLPGTKNRQVITGTCLCSVDPDNEFVNCNNG